MCWQVDGKKNNMAYWLVKSEPTVYSWVDFVKEKQTAWTGVRNHLAQIHLRTMKKGDLVFFYHSNVGLEIVGIATVVKEFYKDPTSIEERWMAVDIKAKEKLKYPVSLATIRKIKSLESIALVRCGRLSVQPINESEFQIIMGLANSKN